MRLAVLVNDGAGSVSAGDRDQERASIEAAFAGTGAEAEVSMVPPDRMAATVRRLWDGPDRPDAIVVAGGDGTVNAAAGAAVDTGAVLGVLPLGTFNHFAKDLGIPTERSEAAAALAAGRVISVDVGEVNGRLFVNNSVLGAYPELVAVRDRLRDQRGWGKVRAVPVAAWRVLRAFPVHRLDLTVGTGSEARAGSRRVRTPFVFVGNGSYTDGTGGPATRTGLDHGALEVLVARTGSRWALARALLGALLSHPDAVRDLDRHDVTDLRVDGRASRLRVALDGEICWMDLPLRYRARPGALRVLAGPEAS